MPRRMPPLFVSFLLDRYGVSTLKLLAEREIRSRFAGTMLGLGHYLLMPLLMLLVYAFAFGIVFKVRWPGAEAGFADFTLRLFAGLIAFQFFAEVVNRASTLILDNAIYVKKLVFPLETLVPAVIAVALFQAMWSIAVLFVAYVLWLGLPPLTALLLPVLWLPLILMTAGMAWVLAALGVFLRDLHQLVSILTSLMMFLTPVFYPLQMVPEPYRFLVMLNPLSGLIEAMRNALFAGESPSAPTLAMWMGGGIIMAQLGYWLFMRTRKAFADVI